MSNKGRYGMRSPKEEQSREAVLAEYTIEAIAYMEHLPATAMNVKCRRQLREVAQYLSAADKAIKAAAKAANHD